MERKTAVEKVLKAFPLNPYDVLDLPTTATQDEIKRQYRKVSLQCHPDKCKEDFRERAQKAFTLLAKSKGQLTDEEKRPEIEQLTIAARTKVKTRLQQKAARERRERAKERAKRNAERKKNLLAGGEVGPEEEEEVVEKKIDVEQDPNYDSLVRKQIKEDIIDREWKARQLMKAAEQEAKRAAEEKEEMDKRREEQQKKKEDWETGRNKRVGDWRSFVGGGKKKKKKKGLNMFNKPKRFEEDGDRTFVRRPVKRPLM